VYPSLFRRRHLHPYRRVAVLISDGHEALPLTVTSGQCPYPEAVELAADLAADLSQHDELIADAHQD
jgi:hypothetical protein